MSLKLTKDSRYKLNSGYEIPVIGLGVFLTSDTATADIVYKALKAGYRHIDTAQFYKNEAQVVQGIAKFLKEHPEVKRSEVFYTTKIEPPSMGYEPAKASIKESLEKAKDIEYIDLFLVHSPYQTKEDRLGSYQALQEYVAAGKIKSIGVSNYGKHHIEELYDWEGFKIPPAVDQIELNPWLTRKELVDYLTSKGIFAEAYSPLTRGYRLDDPELKVLAEKYGVSTAQVLIRWSLDQGYVTLPKTDKEKRLPQNLEAFDFTLTKEELESLTHHDQYYVTMSEWDPVKHQG